MSGTPSFDLSRATRFRDVELLCNRPSIERVTMVLRTVESKSRRQITIHPNAEFANPIGEHFMGNGRTSTTGLILDLTPYSPKDQVRGVEGREWFLRPRTEFFAGANEGRAR